MPVGSRGTNHSKSPARGQSPALSKFTDASEAEREQNKKAYRDLTQGNKPKTKQQGNQKIKK